LSGSCLPLLNLPRRGVGRNAGRESGGPALIGEVGKTTVHLSVRQFSKLVNVF